MLPLCRTARARGLVYAPPRLSVRLCESVWRGQRRTLCSGRGQRPGAKLGIVSSCLGQMLPGNGILNPVLNFLGTWDVVKTLSPANRPSQTPRGFDLNPQPCAGAGQPANFPRLEAWGVYTRQPHALTAAPGLGRTQASGEARGQAAQQRQAAPASRLAKFGLGGLPTRSSSAGQKTPRAASIRAHGPPQAFPERARDSPEPRSQAARTMPRSAGHRPDRTAMAAGRRAGRARGPADRRAPFSASAQSPGPGHPRGPCQRTALPPGGRLRGARGACLPWAPGAQQCSRGGAQRQPRRAQSQPPRGARSRGAGRRAPQNPDWSDGAGRRQGGAGEGGRGPAAPRRASGPPPALGIPLGVARGSPRERLGWWAGGLPPPCAISRDRPKV